MSNQDVAASKPEEEKKEDSKSTGGATDELETCRRERDEYLSGWQRAKADFSNYRKEEMARMEELARYANEDMIRDFITILDNFDLGLAALEKQWPVEKGVYMIRSQIEDTLKRRGLTRIPMKAGDAYNPAIAETVGEVESKHPPGTVAEEIEPGYRLHEKVVRPARVKLSKDKA